MGRLFSGNRKRSTRSNLKPSLSMAPIVSRLA
jgi:hypothetical protein